MKWKDENQKAHKNEKKKAFCALYNTFIHNYIRWYLVPSLNTEVRAPQPIQPNITKRNMKAHSNICANISPEQMLFWFVFSLVLHRLMSLLLMLSIFFIFMHRRGIPTFQKFSYSFWNSVLWRSFWPTSIDQIVLKLGIDRYK